MGVFVRAKTAHRPLVVLHNDGYCVLAEATRGLRAMPEDGELPAEIANACVVSVEARGGEGASGSLGTLRTLGALWSHVSFGALKASRSHISLGTLQALCPCS
jgi:hypothetical protein